MARVSITGALLLLLLFASPATRDLRAQELLVNGGFEDGPGGWAVSGGTFQTQTDVVRSGNVALISASGSLPARLTQGVAGVQPGARYRLRGEVRVSGPHVRYVRLTVALQGASDDGFAPTSPDARDTHGTFQELTTTSPLEVPCDGGQVLVTVELAKTASASVAYAYADNLRLEPDGQPQPCPTATRPPPETPPPGSTPAPPAGPGPGEAGPTSRPPLPRTSLLVNGAFEVAEGGRPSGWRTQGGVLGQVASPVHGGRFAAAFASASSSTKWAYQAVPVTALGWYEMEGYMLLNDSRVEGALLRLSWYASTDSSGSALANVDSTEELVSPDERYRHLTTGAVQAPPGARSAKARILLRPRSASGGVIYIDDVALWESAPGSEQGDAEAESGRSSVRSGGRGSPDVQGNGASETGAYVQQPTPVVRRRDPDELTTAQEGGGAPLWSWALGAMTVAGAGVGFAAYRRRRR
jgi:hypothetical protein